MFCLSPGILWHCSVNSTVMFHAKQQWHLPTTIWNLMIFPDRWCKNSTCVSFLNIVSQIQIVKIICVCSMLLFCCTCWSWDMNEPLLLDQPPGSQLVDHLYSSLWYLCCCSINYYPKHKPAMHRMYNKWYFQYTHTQVGISSLAGTSYLMGSYAERKYTSVQVLNGDMSVFWKFCV